MDGITTLSITKWVTSYNDRMDPIILLSAPIMKKFITKTDTMVPIIPTLTDSAVCIIDLAFSLSYICLIIFTDKIVYSSLKLVKYYSDMKNSYLSQILITSTSCTDYVEIWSGSKKSNLSIS